MISGIFETGAVIPGNNVSRNRLRILPRPGGLGRTTSRGKNSTVHW